MLDASSQDPSSGLKDWREFASIGDLQELAKNRCKQVRGWGTQWSMLADMLQVGKEG